MDQNITLEIAGRQFHLKASSPEMEQSMRFAAEDINNMLSRYTEKYPEKDFVEMLLFVTLTQTVSRFNAQKKLNGVAAEHEKLINELSNYLNNIDSNR